MRRSTKVIAVLAATLVVALALNVNSALSAPKSTLDDGRYQINMKDGTPYIYGKATTFPIIITQPGSYVLTSNVVVPTPDTDGISIESDNVTLDLNGHAIIGPGKESGEDGNGIHADGKNNIAIRNGTVRDFDDHGIILVHGSNQQVTDIRASNNDSYGIYIWSGTITNCTASNNSSGMVGFFGCAITNCTANTNDYIGISGFHQATITNCTAERNGSDGIYSSITSTITNCTAANNSGHGIRATNGHSNITNCSAVQNGGNGIYVNTNTIYDTNCRVEANNLRLNGEYGLYLGGKGSYAIRNVASGNAMDNFYMEAGNYMPLTGDNANYEF